MYNLKKLREEFISLVGISQPNIPGIPEIEEPLSISLSGYFSNSKNPLVETENLYYSAPNFVPSIYSAWKINSAYKKGFPVNYLGVLYISKEIIADSATPPPDDSDNWELYNPFNDWIGTKYNNAIGNLFAEIVKRKKLLGMSKAILDSQQLFKSPASVRVPIVKSGRFLCFQIFLQPSNGLVVTIDKVGFQATVAQTDLKFYLYHSDVQDNEGNWIYTNDNSNTFSWEELKGEDGVKNCIMEYSKNNPSGSYLFGYYEDDVAGNPLSKKWDPSTTPCFACSGEDIYMYNRWSRYVTIRPLSIPSSGLSESKELPDISKANQHYDSNWGMNLQLTVSCDLTSLFIQNKMALADALTMQLTKEFLEAIGRGIRLGPNPAQTKLAALADLDPKAPATWIKSYNDTIDSVNLDFSGFSGACLKENVSKKGRTLTI